MEHKEIKAVFFDCWSTLISFSEKRKDWNTVPLKRHFCGKNEVDWDEVDSFAEQFFQKYYQSAKYEITYDQFLKLIITIFSLKLDCPLHQLNFEVLDGLDPQPIPGIEMFLEYLKKRNCFTAILSDTIYDTSASYDLVKRLIPSSEFAYFFGSCEIGCKKPDPDFFRAGIARSHMDMSSSVYIGDRFCQDVFGSYVSGFSHSVWMNRKGKPKENYANQCDIHLPIYTEVSSYEELFSVFEKGELL